jgi:hypothetical protein
VGFTADGRGAWVVTNESDGNEGTTLRRVDRLDLSTGRMTLFKSFQIPSGMFVPRIRITPDGRSYVYVYQTATSELHLAEGLS